MNRTEKMGSKELQEKKGHLTQMDWEKNGKQIDPQKNWHLEWDGKNGKQIDEKKGGILNGTEKMGSKEFQEKTVILQKWTGKKMGST